MSEWFETLTGLHTRLWAVLTGGSREVTLATVARDGWPEARTVMLRRADAKAATVAIYTDRYSDKITSLRDAPKAAVLLWDGALQLQIRLQAEVFIQTGRSVASDWARVPDPARQSYGTRPRPGTPIADARAYTKPCDQAAFALLHCQVVTIDAVHLGETHRRARFQRDQDWAGQWLSP